MDAGTSPLVSISEGPHKDQPYRTACSATSKNTKPWTTQSIATNFLLAPRNFRSVANDATVQVNCMSKSALKDWKKLSRTRSQKRNRKKLSIPASLIQSTSQPTCNFPSAPNAILQVKPASFAKTAKNRNSDPACLWNYSLMPMSRTQMPNSKTKPLDTSTKCSNRSADFQTARNCYAQLAMTLMRNSPRKKLNENTCKIANHVTKIANAAPHPNLGKNNKTTAYAATCPPIATQTSLTQA